MVRSVLYGSEQVRQETQATLSKVLARGKYVHEMAVHHVKPGCLHEYQEIVGRLYPRMVQDMSPQVKLVGSWMTDIGELDTAVHIWEYQGYPALTQAQLAQLLVKRRSQVMLEFQFWPTHPPVEKGGVYELRSYTLKPGTLLEWEQNWRVGLGVLNQVHHLWQYPDLQVRKQVREDAWSENGWPETVLNTVPLIQEMSSRIMLPMPFSSLK
ncbi:NIPSNAP-domain-containing protein [Linderina pennispora]|uniref:NIPSNAP-domain-containing protein n=1 Tax=Linderina pennispora TaxID=61395 RepID=A0A1Y1VR75_9FUNG|nr:NIPSNAP-domain-containing protein [Linderina pennispora]ORX63555.1 NIPSNAP-domain-containing protein [Linderina pennispora]